MKQVLQDKGNGGIGGGIGDELWERRYEHSATGLSKFPIPECMPKTFSQSLDHLAVEYGNCMPDAMVKRCTPASQAIINARQGAVTVLQRMITTQEELDWHCYLLYGLTGADLRYSGSPPQIALGQRAFEIAMARKMAAGELETTWFERHGSTPVTEIPVEWPDDYRKLVEQRIELIETDCNIDLIEQPQYKRRWNTEPWESQLDRALRSWLLDCLESYFDFR